MKKLFFLYTLIIIFLLAGQFHNLLAQSLPAYIGDLIITYSNPSSYTIRAKVEVVSFPFEGKTEAVNQYYRVDTIQDGTLHRIFNPNNGASSDYEIVYHYAQRTDSSGNILDLGHCANNEIDNGALILNGGWGFGKYKLTIEILQTGETYVCYLNCLDSKYGKDSFQGQNIYGNDWVLHFDGNAPINDRRVIFKSGPPVSVERGEIKTTDTLPGGIPSKEFKVWEMIYNRSQPWAKDFYARSSPFPVSINTAENYVRVFTVGTKVTLDTVFNNLGSSDKYGYNTELGNGSTIPNYYTNPPIEGVVDTGNTFCTPGRKFFLGDPFNIYIHGIKITAENGDTMILKKRKKLWITGTNAQFHETEGDTLELKHGSTFILERNAELFQCRGGRIIQHPDSKII